MQRNKIVLASLISLFSLNTAASAWMPSRENALAYAAGGLVITTGVLVYQVFQLKKEFNASYCAYEALLNRIQDKADAASVKLTSEMQAQRDNLQLYVTRTELNTAVDQAKKDLNAAEKRIIEANAKHIEQCATIAAVSNAKSETVTSKDFATLRDASYIHKTIAEQNAKNFTEALAQQYTKITELGERLTKLIDENKSSNQVEIEAIKKELATFAKSADIKAFQKAAKANIDKIDGLVAVMQKRLKDTDAPTATATTATADSTAASKK